MTDQRFVEMREAPYRYRTNDDIFLKMCHAMTHLQDNPKALEAFFYCRIYTHLHHNPVLMRSTKWVRKEIYGKTVYCLGDDSQNIMTNSISSTLAWMDKFWDDMQEIVGENIRLGDVDFCQTVSEEKMNHFSSVVYRKCMEEVVGATDTQQYNQEARSYFTRQPIFKKYFAEEIDDETSWR